MDKEGGGTIRIGGKKDVTRIIKRLMETGETLQLDEKRTLKWNGRWEFHSYNADIFGRINTSPYVIDEKEARRLVWEFRREINQKYATTKQLQLEVDEDNKVKVVGGD